MSRPYAVFDIDGTILRWQFFHAIGDALARHGYIDQAAYAPVLEARTIWKNRKTTSAYRDYEVILVNIWLKALQQITQQQFEEVNTEVFEIYKDQTYTYTRNLIRDLQSKEYLLFVISGSPKEIVTKFAAYYGFDDFKGVEHEWLEHRFTGTVHLTHNRKRELFEAMITKHNARTTGSIGIGDTSSDISFLEIVEKPIAFNPDKKLLARAQQAGWQIVIERKSIAYTLEQHDGRYVLA